MCDPRLNGFCTDFPLPVKKLPQNEDKELNIPFFMTPEYQRAEQQARDAEKARIAAAVGRERRKLRAKEMKKKKFTKGLLVAFSVFVYMFLAVQIAEIICA